MLRKLREFIYGVGGTGQDPILDLIGLLGSDITGCPAKHKQYFWGKKMN
ncbi:MAG: hypothetical protein ACOCVB_00395 [Bacillota bacterium]